MQRVGQRVLVPGKVSAKAVADEVRSHRVAAGPGSVADAAMVSPYLLQGLWIWAALGALALLLVPAARGQSQLIGWLPFWCLLAPASCLLVAARRAVVASVSAFLADRQRRRPRRGRSQARWTPERRTQERWVQERRLQERRMQPHALQPALPARRLSRRSPAACAPAAARTPR